MAKKATAPTFLDELHTRHEDFRSVEESGARQIRHEMDRIKQQALRTVETGMASATDAGRYLTDAQAVERAKGVIADVEDVVARGLNRVDTGLLSLKEGAWQRGLRDFEVAAESLPSAPKAAIGGSFQQLFPEASYAALTRPTMGIRPNAMWKGVEAGTNENVRQTLLNAVLSGESVSETSAALAEGLDISSGAAERIARTNLNAMYNDAHRSVYKANPRIFAGYRWLAALDDRTSAICIRLHGSFFPLHTDPPGPPAHWNCRSILQGVFRDPALQKEMLADMQRAKKYDAEGNFKDVFIKTRTPADKWLRRQPAWVQQQVLGSKTKAELFKAGKAGIEDIVSPAMEVLSDKKLVRRMAALRPRDRELQALARELDIRVPSKQTILTEDKQLARRMPFQQPQPMPDPTHSPTIPAKEAKAVQRQAAQQVDKARKVDEVPAPPKPERMASQKEWEESLTPEETEAIRNWVGGGVDANWRRMDLLPSDAARLEFLAKSMPRLSAAQHAEQLAQYNTFKQALARAPHSPQIRVYRGIKDVPEELLLRWQTSAEITFEARASASEIEEVAVEFLLGPPTQRGVIFEMASGHRGIKLPDVTPEIAYEAEIMLPAGSQYRVVSRAWEKIGRQDILRLILEAI